MNELIDYTKQILDDIKETSGKTIDDIVVKILEQNGLSIEDVKAHPDEFSIIHDPGHGLRDVIDTFVLMRKGTILGTYAIYSCYDDNSMAMTIRIGYTLGGDS